MKGGEKLSVEFIAIALILVFLIYFFLGVSYITLSNISKIVISLLFLGIFYITRRRNIYEFVLAVLTGATIFISLEISFDLGVWINLLISLISILIACYSYERIKFKDKYALILFILYLIVWIILAFNVSYREDWIMENYLTVPFVIFILISYRWFKLSNISYSLIFVYMTLHIIGSHYTYSEVPFGFWMQNFLDLTRNHYDRIVHFSFGLLLAYPLRELFVRISNAKGFWGLYIPIEFVLAFSAIYEIIEWAVAVIYGGDLGIAYLGTQGDIWDAQKDMALAGLGAVFAMIITFLIIVYYNSKKFFKELGKSFKVKQKRILGERVISSYKR
ncbi:MAG: DUF2238 domain-containing protein [Nanoarchaeota archaeon]|nr:DUF2238 domain-containing protein [Nanoarchaeota archaeon]